jgi:hypothetical protein
MSTAKVYADLMKNANWLERASIDLERIQHIFASLSGKRKKGLPQDTSTSTQDTSASTSGLNTALEEAVEGYIQENVDE